MSLSLECASSINRGKYCVFTYKILLVAVLLLYIALTNLYH